jgi:uncharacterized cupin superfamily protein
MAPNILHLDDVEPLDLARGPLAGHRQRLGAAAGAARAGLSRYVLGPGERPMPVHVHADEEELFYVVAGAGVSWQDGRTWRVQAGDLLVHLPGGAAHAIVAGDEGMEVLAFGAGSDTGMTWLPRAQAWWMGPRWLPDDGPSPFAKEVEAGPLERPEPEAGPPPASARLAEVPEKATDRPGYRERWRDLGRAAGSVACGVKHCVLEAGQLSSPPHWHSGEEEAFLVLAGGGEVLLDEVPHPVRPGSLIWCPPDTGVGHALRAGPDGMTYLAFGTRVAGEFVFYPRSGKVNLGHRLIFRPELLDYFDGEELD